MRESGKVNNTHTQSEKQSLVMQTLKWHSATVTVMIAILIL